ncbi:hypothetical protein TCAL_16886 [Tigriopus californicus]|uniref:Uncharacterized protein n=1 Tax=Tigriopus californicus TaxID=6832 RepID=A0A553P6A2_TIGCA|nr:hypothetical protein TCAL_16886 [Tigriopus californicus]
MKSFIRAAVIAVAAAAPAADQPEPAYKPTPAPYKPAPYKPPLTSPPPTRSLLMMSARTRAVTVTPQRRVPLWLLPDGRTQIVTYNTADAYSGNVADVRYEGEPQYPKYEPKQSYKPAPKYKPAPTYKPAPSYEA